MKKERELLAPAASQEAKAEKKKLIEFDGFGIAAFALAATLGLLVGGVKVAKFFTLGTTGGTLIVSLILGYVAHIGPFNITPKESTLKVFRETGLMLFLVGAGISGGIDFVEYFDIMYFVYGVIMTIVPMIVGYCFARYVLKLSLLNNLGAITGGMTSTPALGTLINVAETETVASAYAATYPIALIAVVLVSQFLIILF
jgi:putative transport protein